MEQIVGMDRAKVAAGLVLTAPFVPMIFQGEEFAASTPFQYFADHEDPEMARAVKEGDGASLRRLDGRRRMFPIRRTWRRLSGRS